MADTKISALPSGTTPLGGTEPVPIVQAGVTVQVPASAFAIGPLTGDVTTASAGSNATTLVKASGGFDWNAQLSDNTTTGAVTNYAPTGGVPVTVLSFGNSATITGFAPPPTNSKFLFINTGGANTVALIAGGAGNLSGVNITLSPNQGVMLAWDPTLSFGSGGYRAIGTTPAYATSFLFFDIPGTTSYTFPGSMNGAEVYLIGAGGGGGAGGRSSGVASGVACGGNGGDSGCVSQMTITARAAGQTATLVVGAGGAGGAAQTVTNTAGATGTNGGASTFTLPVGGTVLTANGGNGGTGGAVGVGATQTAQAAITTGGNLCLGNKGGTGGDGTAAGGVGGSWANTPGQYASAAGGGGGGCAAVLNTFSAPGAGGSAFGLAGGTAGTSSLTAATAGSSGATNSNAGFPVASGAGGGGALWRAVAGSSAAAGGTGNPAAANGAGAGGGGGGARSGVSTGTTSKSGAGGAGADGMCIVVIT